MLEHGGNLLEAMRRFGGRPREEWIDLSTGINPQGYPVPALPENSWQRLPENDPTLIAVAREYYGASSLLPVAGTQAAIQALPMLRKLTAGSSRVVVASPTYAEHAHQWRKQGHPVRELAHDELAEIVDDCEVMVVCNPNNPTGNWIDSAQLVEWAQRLATRGGWLIVDEAFVDVFPQMSVAPSSDQPGLIVLRSVGKFFGLAGLRLGFVAAPDDMLLALSEMLGPWTVSTPAQIIGGAALGDKAWQRATRLALQAAGERLQQLLAIHEIVSTGTPLFQWWEDNHPEVFWQYMAERGIWVRGFTQNVRGIRLGLPASEMQWQCLAVALKQWNEDKAK